MQLGIQINFQLAVRARGLYDALHPAKASVAIRFARNEINGAFLRKVQRNRQRVERAKF